MSTPQVLDKGEVEVGTAASGRETVAVVVAVIAAVLAAEAVAAFASPISAAVTSSVLLVGLVLRWVQVGEVTVLLLSLVPLGRLISSTVTTRPPTVLSYAVAGLPLLVGVLCALRRVSSKAGVRMPRLRATPVAALVALTGVPLGYAIHTLVDLPVIAGAGSTATIAIGAPVVFLMVGVVGELLYRGLLQRSFEPLFGPWSVVVADVLFAAGYLSMRDVRVLFAVASVGLAFGWFVRATGRLLPVAVAHGLLAAGALVIWPALG